MSKTKWYSRPIYALFALALALSLGIVAVPMAGTVEASPDGTVEIAQIINPADPNQTADNVALFNWLADYDTDVTQITVGDMVGKDISYWTQFDVIVLPTKCSLSIANLLSSGVPIISMSTGYADELGLGTGEMFQSSSRDFYVIDNTHPITSELDLGLWPWSPSQYMWTYATENAGYTETTTVLVEVDSGKVGEDILIVHTEKKYAYFGWYKPNQWPAEGWDLLEKTIEWAIDRPLPPFSMELTVEITDPDTDYKPGETINIKVDTGKAGYTVTGDFSDFVRVPKMAGIAYTADNWWKDNTYYWLDTYLGSLGYTVDGILQGTAGSYTSAQWEAYDVVFIFSNNFATPDLTNLIDSNVPIIMTGYDINNYAPQAGLGDGTSDKEVKQIFYVVDDTHPITQGLSLGEWSFASSMWTTRIGTSGCAVNVLIDDNGSPAKAYLATRQDPNRVWFGYYSGTQAGAEAEGIFRNSIAWTLGKDSLPNLKAYATKDATDNGDGTYSISYTIGYIPLFGTHTIPITAEDQVGHTATDDSLSVTIPVPTEVWVDDGYAAGPDVGPSESCGGHIWGYDAFSTIQEGINTVDEGGTVNVAAGEYTENVDVDRQVTIIGAGEADTIVTAADERDNVFEVTANGVNISGFTVQGVDKFASSPKRAGIYLGGVSSCVISNNTATENYIGIRLEGSDGNTITENTCNDNYQSGIDLESSSSNPITGNICTSNGASGISLYLAEENTLTDNDCTSNGMSGIYLSKSSYNTITGNFCNLNDAYGMHLTGMGPGAESSHNTITDNTCNSNQGEPFDNGAGIVLFSAAPDNTIEENTCNSNTKYGIWVKFYDNDSNVITGNTLKLNALGIEISSSSNTIEGNTIESNTDTGILNSGSAAGNKANFNNIVGNAIGVKNTATEKLDAENNWWGDASGPSGVGPGTGNAVSDNVDYSPWLGATTGTSPMTWYTNDSIQDAIDAADTGDTINVAAGTYTEDLTIGVEGLTLQAASSPVLEGSITVANGADGVTIDGFRIEGAGVSIETAADVTVTGCTTVGLGPNGGVNGIVYSHSAPSTGGTVTSNIIQVCEMGICLDHDGLDFTVTGNTLEGCRKAISVGSDSTATITGNTITGSTAMGVEVFKVGTTVNYNNIYGNAEGVWSGAEVDAECNWWGSVNGPGQDGANGVSGDVDYSPWLPGEWELFFDDEGNLIDTDGDTFSNLEECWLGTDPNDAGSYPAAGINPDEVDNAFVEGSDPDEVDLQDTAGTTIADVDISDAPSDASGTITGARYTDEPEPDGTLLSVGTGKTGVIFLDVRVTGYTSGMAHITVPYLDTDNDGIVDGTDIVEDTLGLYYWDEAAFMWRIAANNAVDTTANNVSGDIPVSALAGTPIGGGGYPEGEATVAIESITNLTFSGNDIVDLTITTGSAQLGAVTIDLTFDNTVVEVLGGENSVFDSLTVNPSYGTQTARFVANQLGESGVDAADGAVLAQVRLKAVGTTGSSSPLELTVITLKDNDGVSIPVGAVINGTATIGGLGDANSDGAVDVYDCVYIARAIAGIPGYIVNGDTMDVDGKDDVDAFDCTYLARHIAGIPGYELGG